MEKNKDPQINFDEREFNASSYRQLGQGRIDQAIFIFELNANAKKILEALRRRFPQETS